MEQSIQKPNDKFPIFKLLEEGSYSKIYLFHHDPKSKPLILKCVDHSKGLVCLRALQNEFEILQNLDHPNILRSIQIRKDQLMFQAKYNVMVTEYASNQTLYHLYKNNNKIDIRVSRNIIQSILNGLTYIHQRNYCHRDIKLENIFVFEDFSIKIGDFGFCCNAGDPNQTKDNKCYSFKGTRRGYMPPEIHRILEKDKSKKMDTDIDNDQNQNYYYDGKKADIFSFGVTIFAILFENIPFVQAILKDKKYQLIAQKNYDQFWKINQAQLDYLELQPGSMVEDLKDLLQQMLSADPKERPTCEELRAHPWMNGTVFDTKNYLINKICNSQQETNLINK